MDGQPARYQTRNDTSQTLTQRDPLNQADGVDAPSVWKLASCAEEILRRLVKRWTSISCSPVGVRSLSPHNRGVPSVACCVCGQDWLAWYRVRATGQAFLLCPECDAVWLPGDDVLARSGKGLGDLFPDSSALDCWDLIESAAQ